MFIEEATQWALDADKISVSERGPLHGLPVSFKECFQVKGYDFTAGLSKFLFQPAVDDGNPVKAMKEFGAIPFCLTNIPQTMYSYGCSNPIYGNTKNPFDDSRTSGGSSGGEGCLLAMGGSVLGIGTDVGGSVRIPATFCGSAGLRPTSTRFYQVGRRFGGKVMFINVHSNPVITNPNPDKPNSIRVSFEARKGSISLLILPG